MNEEQFRQMRKLRKEINRIRSELSKLNLATNNGTIREVEEQLSDSIDKLDTIEEGSWL
ncbi:hypothetical protein [Cohnella soli]|uniref:Aspartyl-phosphate phosphatase Spo0E family protein n=1 Tax=Cohnella soli TaxID=425005 RepID=A0ABW0I598_9BACL